MEVTGDAKRVLAAGAEAASSKRARTGPGSPDGELAAWTAGLELAEEMVPLLGKLYRKHNVVATVFGHSLQNQGPIGILRIHDRARQQYDGGAGIVQTHALLVALAELDVGACRVDLGKIAAAFAAGKAGDSSGGGGGGGAAAAAAAAASGGGTGLAERAFLESELRSVLGSNRAPLLSDPHGQDVVLFGFGRIGRLLARVLVGKTGGGDKLRLRAIVVRPTKGGPGADLEKRATLLRIDSVHGAFDGIVATDAARNALIVNGNVVQLLYAAGPEAIDYTAHGIRNAIVVDNTGVFRDRAALSRHLAAPGVAKVVLTAPSASEPAGSATKAVPNIVMGVNESAIDPSETIVAAASCTTNATCPVLKALNDRFGIVSGHIETVHSFTNDQNLIDNFHPKARRGRSAALNMVITETGAAAAVGKAMPELAGKLTGNAIRVPTPNVSMAILVLQLREATSADGINEFLRQTSLQGPLQHQIDFSASPEMVSSDFVGSAAAGVVDSVATIVSAADPTRVNLYVWYDNEFGYSSQVIRLTQLLGGVVHPKFPQ